MTEALRSTSDLTARLAQLTLYRWWRRSVVGRVDHEAVVARIVEDSGWSARFAFMTMMSAGIAVLGLLLSSPAVVIGAMLISPLMSPILGFGFSLALFDFAELRRSLKALAIGAGAAVAFTALIVLVSPLRSPRRRSSRAHGRTCSIWRSRSSPHWPAPLPSFAGGARRSWASRSQPRSCRPWRWSATA